VINFYQEQNGEIREFSFEKILHLFILEELLQSGEIHQEEGKMLIQLLNDHVEKITQKGCELILIRKFGISSCLLVSNAENVQFEKGTKVVVKIAMNTYIEELKTKLL
jgi:rRNA pseudouridine-1189 N-methylase Emg1 (Nep1/Mra1 family)